MIVDTHCHCSSRWYEPVDSLLFNMDRCGVDRAFLTQVLGSRDSSDMIAACKAHPDRFTYIAAIDPAGPAPSDAIAAAAADGAMGLRMRAGWRSGGADPLALWHSVEAAGLLVSMVGSASDFTADAGAAEVAAACPALPIILEHLGGLARPDVGDRAAMTPQVCALAAHDNISIKLPGLGQLAPRQMDLDTADFPLDLSGVDDVLSPVFAAFGPARIMWGSDFPPVASREGYANALGWTRDYVAQRWPEAVDACFGGNALTVIER